MSAATIPITIRPEAAERVAELGMQRELDRMLDFLCGELPGLLSVEVKLALPYDTGDESRILLKALLDCAWSDASARRRIHAWRLHSFPPQVDRHFTIVTVPAPLPGGESLLPKEAIHATDVFVKIHPEADQRVAELGIQRELRALLERTIFTLPGLKSVEVTLRLPYDTGAEVGVTITATVDEAAALLRQREKELLWWRTEAFPPIVGQYFSFSTHSAVGAAEHGR